MIDDAKVHKKSAQNMAFFDFSLIFLEMLKSRRKCGTFCKILVNFLVDSAVLLFCLRFLRSEQTNKRTNEQIVKSNLWGLRCNCLLYKLYIL